MSKRMKRVISVIVCMLFFLLGSAVGATGVAQEIKASLVSDFKFVMDGKSVTPRDVSGNLALPIVYEGRTYLPVRAFGNLFNCKVEWQADTKTVVLATAGYVPPAVDGALPESELNDTQASANIMPLNAKMKGDIRSKNELTGQSDKEDYYKIVLDRDGTLKLKLTSEALAKCYLRLYNNGESDPLANGKNTDEKIVELTQELKAGTYYVSVGSAYTTSTTYTLENTLQ